MEEPIIKIEGLGKKYTIGTQEPYMTLRDQFAGIFSNKKNKSKSKEEFWALKDINLEINRGDTIGIIGRNGAGKSTLLKILSQITPPTEGKVTMDGRVASLLEVGTGFSPELTGRENIYLNGAILGMTRKEIKRKFNEIVAFSEIEKFLDTPVKRYSSGMYVRLAFAVAAHLEPEILIVDEVLAVGDAQFQKKCLGKMSEVGKSGRTVIFVSHNLAAIKALCKKCILIDRGRLVEFGNVDKVVSKYTDDFKKEKHFKKWSPNDRPRNHTAVINSVSLINDEANESSLAEEVGTDDDLWVKTEFEVMIDNNFVGLTAILHDENNICVFSSINNREPNWYGKPMAAGKYKTILCIPANFLNAGKYNLSLNLFGKNFSDSCLIEEVLVFTLSDGSFVRGDYFGNFAGVTRPLLKWRTSKLNQNKG